VVIEVSSDRSRYFSVSLFRITKLKFPDYYSPFFLDDLDWPEKGKLMAGFSTKQLEEIDNYSASISWHYETEESLAGLLEEIKIQLIKVGLPTLEFAKEHGPRELETFAIVQEIKKKSQQLYLQQLDPISRFPLE
jgi:hypothetical protein